MAGLSHLPEAIPTSVGWAHPLTGEQLDVTSGLDDAVDYYKANSGARSFIDPEGETEFLAFAVTTGQRVKAAIHTLHQVVSVEWDWGDGSDPEEGGLNTFHFYEQDPSDEEYTIAATVTYLAPDPEDEEATVEETEELTIDVTVPANGPADLPVNTVAPSITGTPTVSETLTGASGTWTGDPTPTYTYQWQEGDTSDGDFTDITGETAATIDLEEALEGKYVRVRVTGTNRGGSVEADSPAVGPVVASGG